MSSILKIPPKYNLCISQSWSFGGHGISGHIYETIDYYLILKDHFDVCILLPDGITLDQITDVIKYKYDLSDEIFNELISNIIFDVDPKILICKNILIVDGYYGIFNFVIKADNIFMFACPVDNAFSRVPNHYILQDYRIYPSGKNTINYIKKINFDVIKKPKKSDDKILLYGTKNCRLIPNKIYEEISKNDKEIVCIVDSNYADTDDITYLKPPVDNLFELFSTYMYTPVSVEFDCSPRFIAECKYFKKDVLYYDVTYDDEGLFWRNYDIRNQFKSLYLTKNDIIIDIIGDIIG